MSKVIVVGSLNMDTTLRVPHIPVPGETILATGISSARGGKGQNQAVAMARLGAKVEMIGAVGSDDDGDQTRSALMKDGVGVEGLFTKQVHTGIASIYLDDQSRNNIVVYPGANFELTAADIRAVERLFDGATYCVMQLEIPLPVIYHTLELCHRKGITTILNPAPAAPDFDWSYLKYVDYLVPNESELELIAGEALTQSNLEALSLSLINRGLQNILVTLGSRGSAFFSASERFQVPALVVEAVDTTAAGDSFIGGFTTYLAEGKGVKEAMEFATKVAAIAVTKPGAIDSLPMRGEIEGEIQ
ncbi:MAG: ribokinase [Tissierellia bacterium]|nr:ribokinase [Tissierellia bacterium]